MGAINNICCAEKERERSMSQPIPKQGEEIRKHTSYESEPTKDGTVKALI